MKDKSKILERIRKLLTMAADQSSPAEAAIAANRARKLMDTWQINESDVPDFDDFLIRQAGKARKFTPKWENIMAVAVANYNDCIATYSRSSPVSGHKATFKGYGPDVDLCVMVYEHLVSVGCVECSRCLPTKRYNARLGTAFKEAYATEVCARLKKLTIERNGEVAFQGGKELMLRKIEMVKEQFGDASYVSTQLKIIKDNREAIAASLGRKAGETVPLHAAVNDQPMMLGHTK